MLLMVLICQVAYEPVIEPSAPSAGAIVLQEPYQSDILWPLSGRMSKWNPITAAQAIEDDPGLKALWTTSLARVNGEVVTGQDVLFRQAEELLAWREKYTPSQFAELVQRTIQSKLPRVVNRAALWTVVKKDYPQNLLDDSWKRHEQSWEDCVRPNPRKKTPDGRRVEAQPMPESWKPYWIRYYVTEEFLVWKFAPEQASNSETLTTAQQQHIAEFKQDIVKQATIETAYVLQKNRSRIQPGSIVNPATLRSLRSAN